MFTICNKRFSICFPIQQQLFRVKVALPHFLHSQMQSETHSEKHTDSVEHRRLKKAKRQMPMSLKTRGRDLKIHNNSFSCVANTVPFKVVNYPFFANIIRQISHPEMSCLSHHLFLNPTATAPRTWSNTLHWYS